MTEYDKGRISVLKQLKRYVNRFTIKHGWGLHPNLVTEWANKQIARIEKEGKES